MEYEKELIALARYIRQRPIYHTCALGASVVIIFLYAPVGLAALAGRLIAQKTEYADKMRRYISSP
jgi:hypothetical protein